MDYKLNNSEIGERIRSIRESLFMSRERFSEMVDISEVFLGQIERGECSLSLKTLSNIIAYTGTSSDFILYGKDDSNDIYIKKIERMLYQCSDETLKFIYDLIRDVQKFSQEIKDNSKT